MSTPYDYTPPPPSTWGSQLPILLLALTICLYLATQLTALQAGAKTIRWQMGNVEKQIENVKAAEKQADDAAARLAEPFKQATDRQTEYSALFNDVYNLSKDDDDTKTVVTKWKIQRNQNAPADSESKKKE